MPLARGYQYRHAILRSYGLETYYIKDELEMEENQGLLDEIINKQLDENLY